MKRFEGTVLIGSFTGFCWLAMQVVHELGHVLGALFTGGKVSNVVLHPFTISHTFLSHNPMPLVVVWAGPIIGSIVPLLGFLIAKVLKIPGGVYIGVGCFQGMADAGEMIKYGSNRSSLILFGIASCTIGLCMWNGLGPKFGLGKSDGAVSRPATIISLALFLLIITTELIIGGL
jgi:hypothetical protein